MKITSPLKCFSHTFISELIRSKNINVLPSFFLIFFFFPKLYTPHKNIVITRIPFTKSYFFVELRRYQHFIIIVITTQLTSSVSNFFLFIIISHGIFFNTFFRKSNFFHGVSITCTKVLLNIKGTFI